MKIKVTHPIRDGERLYLAGNTVEVDAVKAKRWIENEWCFEIENELPKIKKVKYEPKPTQE